MEYINENVEGVVAFFGQNKFDKNQFVLKLEGSDNYYYQKAAYNKVYPRKGETVRFLAKGKFFTNLYAEYS